MSEEIIPEVPKGFAGYASEMKESFSVLIWVWREFVHTDSKRRMTVLIFSVFAIMVFLMTQPILFGKAIDSITNDSMKMAMLCFGGLAFVVLARMFSEVMFQLIREKVWHLDVFKLQERTNVLFFEKSLGQHLEDDTRLNYASIERAKNRVEGLQEMLIFETVSVLLRLVVSFCLVWFFSQVAGAAMLLLLVVHVLFSLYLNYRVAVETTPIEINWRAYNRRYVERWEKITRVKTSGKEEREHNQLLKLSGDILEENLRFWNWFTRFASLRAVVSGAIWLSVIAYALWQYSLGLVTVAFLMPIFIWTLDIVSNLWMLGATERRINEQVPYLRAMRKALDTPPAFSANTGVMLSKDEPVSISFENVGMTFESTREEEGSVSALSGISFHISPGEKVALIGPSGAGKTTVMKLLLRFYDPTEGKILVNGHPLEALHHAGWMHRVGYIPQQAEILDGTVRYNLLFGLSDEEQATITDAEIWEVMRLLKIDFVERLTDGLETRVGRNGYKLSGGQSQRIMVGAAAIKRPSFMIIDEATSSLDAVTERHVQNGLEEVLAGPSGALIVTHRLPTVRDVCNRFIVLRDLSDVKEGESQIEAVANSFEELYDISPTFRELADVQGVTIRPHQVAKRAKN